MEGGSKSVATQSSDRPELLVCRRQRLPLNRVVDLDDLLADVGEHRAAAIWAALRASDGRLAQCVIDVFDHEPRPAIGHPQIMRGRPNRPFRSNGFKQKLSCPDQVVSVGKIETKPKVGIVHEDFSTGRALGH